MENTVIRVTKAQKLEAIMNNLPENFNVVFPGDADGKKTAYTFDREEAMKFIQNEIALLNKKSASSSGKQTATQKENEGHKKAILEYLEALPSDTDGVTCTAVFKNVASLYDYSTSKASALLRQLKDAGLVTSKEVKGSTLYRLA